MDRRRRKVVLGGGASWGGRLELLLGGEIAYANQILSDFRYSNYFTLNLKSVFTNKLVATRFLKLDPILICPKHKRCHQAQLHFFGWRRKNRKDLGLTASIP